MLVQNRSQFEAVRTTLVAADQIVVDTETTGLYPHQGDRLCGIATLCPVKGKEQFHIAAYFPFRHKPGDDLFSQSENLPIEWLQELLRVLNRPTEVELIFHHAKFDLAMLKYEGMDFLSHRDAMFQCTQIMAWLNNESESHKLKDLHEKYIEGSQSKEREALIKKYVKREGSYQNVPPAIMEPYACGDVEDTWDLFHFLREKLNEPDLRQLLQREYQFCRLLFDMEWNGIGIDPSLAEQLSYEATRRMRELENEIGFDPLKLNELARRLFLNPPVGLGLHPESLTKTSSPDFPEGIPEIRKEFLSQHIELPLVRSVIEYKSLVKANSTWFSGFLSHASKTKDGRLHTTFNSAGREGKVGTKTGRLNSSKPNVQQIPRKDEAGEDKLQQRVKDLFIPARQRWGLFEFDYSQIELRLAAVYGNAEPLIDALISGSDPHQVTAQRIGCSRQTAKHATYTTLYGGGAARLAETIERLEFLTTGRVIDYPEDEAQEILNAFFALYPGLKQKNQEAARVIRQRGYVQIWNGRRRHYERWFDPKQGKMVDNGHKAFNSVVQGGAGEIIKESMLLLDKASKPFAYRVVNQVHDSLWVEIVDDFREEYIEEVKHIMEWPSRDERFKVPFEVDIKCLNLEPFDEALWSSEEVMV